jgi:hypothetical protein
MKRKMTAAEALGEVVRRRAEGGAGTLSLELAPGENEGAVVRGLRVLGFERADNQKGDKMTLSESVARATSRLLKSSSEESDRILAGITGEGEAPPVRHKTSGKFLQKADDAATEAVKQAKRILANPASSARERNIAAHVLKSEVQAALNGEAVPAVGGMSDAADVEGVGGSVDPKYIERMTKALNNPRGTAEQKEIIGERLTRHLLGAVYKTRADAELEASNQAQRATMTAVTASHTNPPAGLKPGSMSLGTPAGANRGDFNGPSVGRHVEPPGRTEETLVDELQKAVNPLERQRLSEDLTLSRLRLLRRPVAA